MRLSTPCYLPVLFTRVSAQSLVLMFRALSLTTPWTWKQPKFLSTDKETLFSNKENELLICACWKIPFIGNVERQLQWQSRSVVNSGWGRGRDLTAETRRHFHSIKAERNVLFDDHRDSYMTVNKYQKSLVVSFIALNYI